MHEIDRILGFVEIGAGVATVVFFIMCCAGMMSDGGE